jgi:hypothetical protein
MAAALGWTAADDIAERRRGDWGVGGPRLRNRSGEGATEAWEGAGRHDVETGHGSHGSLARQEQTTLARGARIDGRRRSQGRGWQGSRGEGEDERREIQRRGKGSEGIEGGGGEGEGDGLREPDYGQREVVDWERKRARCIEIGKLAERFGVCDRYLVRRRRRRKSEVPSRLGVAKPVYRPSCVSKIYFNGWIHSSG